ncbi:MAG TPA: PPC domain-containing DNA-binding protein [Candidatus Dormibacteraeota bacterium]|jgi:predicted DNA-binding protein with PD1-like motif|nr:PPC domain-containing DNA-binding protein [Candidatus Dormibacteraeota bacterium]
MLFAKKRTGYVLRLEQGDDILKTIKKFGEAKRVRAAFFEGIGSLYKARLGHYDFQQTKTYKYETFDEDLEILSLSGNMSTMNQQALPHAHATLGRRDFSVIGGHLEEGSLANMVEINLAQLPGKLEKAKDSNIGLNLLQLPNKF